MIVVYRQDGDRGSSRAVAGGVLETLSTGARTLGVVACAGVQIRGQHGPLRGASSVPVRVMIFPNFATGYVTQMR